MRLGYNQYNIVHLEMINILVVIHTWGRAWMGKTLLDHCDNAAVVSVLKTVATKDSMLAAIARNITVEVTKLDINLHSFGIAGQINIVADGLSRWALGPEYRSKFYSIPLSPVGLDSSGGSSLKLSYLIVGVPTRVAGQASRAAARVSTGFCNSTVKCYDSMFRVFSALCVFAGDNLLHLSPTFVLAFLEFLTLSKLSPQLFLTRFLPLRQILTPLRP